MSKKENEKATFYVKKVYSLKRNRGSDIKHQLRNIYRDKNGKIPNMGRLERKKGSFLRFFIWIILFIALVFLGVMAVSFYLFGSRNFDKFTSDRVSVEIVADETVSLGQDFSFTVYYGNDEDVALTQAQLILRIPDSFTVVRSFPEPTQEYIWELGTLLPGKQGSVKIDGFFVNDLGTKERITADILYWPENFHSEFHETASATVLLKESIIQANIISQEIVTIQEEFSYLFELKNTTKSDLKDIKIEFSYPSGFLIKRSIPAADEEDNIWKIDSLREGEKVKIEILGSYRPSSTSGTKQFLATISVFSEQANTYLTQKEITYMQKLAKDDLSINLLANNSTTDSSLEFGDRVYYTILYSNQGDIDIEDLTVRLKLDGDIIDWLNFQIEEPARLEGTTLYWDIEDGLKSGAEGVLKITIPIITNPEEADGDSFSITAIAQASSDGEISWKKESNTITNYITSSITLTGLARYRDALDNIVGNGTFPPIAGQKTTYQLRYILDNGLQEISSVMLIIPLSKDVLYEGGVNVSTGTLDYDAALHQVVWKISRIPAGVVGLQASFLGSIVPTEDDLDQNILLAKEGVLTAHNNVLGTEISEIISEVTAPLK